MRSQMGKKLLLEVGIVPSSQVDLVSWGTVRVTKIDFLFL